MYRRAERAAECREGFSPRLDGGVDARHAEVGEQRLSVRDEQVLRLHVAMHHAVLVRIAQCVGHLADDAYRFSETERVVRVEAVAKRSAFDHWHDEIQEAVRAARVVERQDVRMLETRHQHDLAREPLGADGRRVVGMQHLECDGPVVLEVVREVHGRHAAAADLAADTVLLPQATPDALSNLFATGHEPCTWNTCAGLIHPSIGDATWAFDRSNASNCI
jgi:hypothetical protein